MAPKPVADPKELLRLSDALLEFQDAKRSFAHYGRGLTAYRTGDWEGALKWCAKSHEAIPPHDSEGRQSHVLNFLVEAMASQRLGRTKEAKAAYENAQERLTDDVKEAANLGGIREANALGIGQTANDKEMTMDRPNSTTDDDQQKTIK
jgi:hypothetical protein